MSRRERRERRLKSISVDGEVVIEDDRQIIRVGNSEGLTLAPKGRSFLFGVGKTLGRKLHLEFVRDYDGRIKLVITPLEDEEEEEQEEP